MAKDDYTIFVIIGIIIAVAFLWQGGYFGELLSAISIQELSCSRSGTGEWTCGNYRGSFSEGINGKINFRITKPSAVEEWNSLRCSVSDCRPQGESEPNSVYSSYIGTLLGTQFAVIEGNYNDRCPSGSSTNHSTRVKTYGLCNGRDCWVYDMFPNTPHEAWSNVGTDNTCGLLEVQSIKIYSKNGGYTEEEGKNEFGFNVVDNDIIVYRLENNQCFTYTIKESTKLSTDYNNLNDCENDILISCTPNWQIGSWSSCVNNQQIRTVTDSNNCNNISNKPIESQSCTLNQTIQNISVYRLSSNICALISINPSQKTSNDYNIMSQCQEKIIECLKDDDCNSVCVDKASVCTLGKCYCDDASITTLTTFTGSGGVVYSYSTIDTNAEETISEITEKSFFDKYKWLIIGILIVIGGIIFLYNRK